MKHILVALRAPGRRLSLGLILGLLLCVATLSTVRTAHTVVAQRQSSGAALGDVTPSLCRYGVDALGDTSGYSIGALGAGWFVNFTSQSTAPPSGISYYPTVRLQPTASGSYRLTNTTLEAVATAAQQDPGQTWIVGNEPDRRDVQDSLLPSVYAEAYHDVHMAIKAADPTARIANGGIVQVTPARLLYLDQVLENYAAMYGSPMPVDVWNIHVYIIREASCQYYPKDCWGAELPPGIDWPTGELYSIDDNANVGLFKQMVLDFRAWMASHGYSHRPLIITEFGVQMPPDLGSGFPPERVNAYMNDTFDFLRTATGPNGYVPDGNRLVQQWAWWSLQRPVDYEIYWNGWLYDPDPPQRTVFGDNYAAYTAEIDPVVNFLPVSISTEPPSVYSTTDPVTVTLSARIANDGEINYSGGFVVRFYAGSPGDTSHQIGSDQIVTDLGGCGRWKMVSVTMPNVTPGIHPVYVVVDPLNAVSESNETDNLLSGIVLVATNRVFLPLVSRGF